MKKQLHSFILGSLAFAAAFGLNSCKDKDKKPTAYEVPTTYNFSDANYSKATQRLDMLAEMTTYIRTTHSNTLAPILDAQKLKNMYANSGSSFTAAVLNSSGIQLKDQTGNTFGLQAMLEASFDDAVTASTNAAVKPTETTASSGVAGKLINGTRYILVDSTGLEYKEVLEKGIMGGVFYYQATTRLQNIASFDNANPDKSYTAQEQAWDEAFGYFGVPVDFPTNVTGLKNWGSYCNNVSTALGGSTTLNSTIMNAWIKGRAAISHSDDKTRNEMRDILLKNWEKVCAARFISYVKGAKTNIAAPATFNHNLSEAIGFIHAFRYNPAKSISDADLDILLNYFKTNGKVNLYKVSSVNLDNAISKMAFLFGLDASLL